MHTHTCMMYMHVHIQAMCTVDKMLQNQLAYKNKYCTAESFHWTKISSDQAALALQKISAHKSRGEKGENLQLYSITIQQLGMW